MNWIVTGSAGQLGRALCARLSAREDAVLLAAPDRSGLDIGDAAAVERFFAELPERPDVVANAAAFTHVDRCESEPEAALRVNALGPAHLARACESHGARLVHVSTDYVFPGDAEKPYREDDPTGPRSAYGRTKLAGEERVLESAPGSLIVRTSWVFGRGRNFIGAILGQVAARRRGEASGPLRVVDDQRGRPTWAHDLALALVLLAERDARGLVHVANADDASWWELARFCCDEAGAADLAVEAIATRELDLPAPRPAYSLLDCSRAEALGVRLRPWREAVRGYLRSADSPLAPERAAPRRAGSSGSP